MFQIRHIRHTMQEEMGYEPGMFRKRRKTDSLDGIRMAEEDIKKWKQSTDGMSKKDFIRDVKAEEEEKKRLEAEQTLTAPIDVSEMYTVLMPAIPKSLEPGTTDKMISQILTPQVDVQVPIQELQEPIEEPDEDELTLLRPAIPRPQQKDALFFEIRDPQQLSTLKLAEEAVNLCIEETGKYPSAIILSHSRYAAMSSAMRATGGFYITQDITRIPYKCVKEVVDYDVAAICEV